MQIQVNGDTHIAGNEALQVRVRTIVTEALTRWTNQVTRVEVHLSDENGDKGGSDDKRCMMEARLEGRHPTAVTAHASTVELAVEGAAERLESALRHALDQKRDHRHDGPAQVR
jgi:ribosome-associated translation inhibitor RaiA